MPNPLPPEFPFDAEGGQGPSAEPLVPVSYNLPPGSVLPAGLNGPIVINLGKSLRDMMETARKTGHDEAMDIVRAVQANNAAAGRQTPPLPVEAKKPALSKGESEAKVKDYLKAHKARASKGEVSIREINKETGVPIPSIQGTIAWRALQDRLEKEGLSKRPRRRKAQAFTPAMESVAEDVQLRELTAEQAADDEGSPLGKGRRGKVRVRKQF